MQRFLLGSVLVALPLFSQAQQQEPIHLYIDANVDGQRVKIDTFIQSLTDLNIGQFLQELGVENELNQLNIDINSGFGMTQGYDQAAMEEMLRSLSNIEIPEMPQLPEMPAMPEMPEMNFDLGGSYAESFGFPNKAVMGVYTQRNAEGAEINGLVEGGAAVAAGLMEGDIITHIDQRTIESPSNLNEVIGMYAPGDEIQVTYLRGGKSEKVNLTLQENAMASGNFYMPDSAFNFSFSDSMFNNGNFVFQAPEAHGYLGVYLDDTDNGVIVTGIEEGSAAEKAGLKADDMLRELNGKKVQTYDEVLEIMQDTKPDQEIHIIYERNGKKKDTDAKLQSSGSGAYYFNFNNGEEGYAAPDVQIAPCLPCPPGSSYSYHSGDGSKTVNICITTAPMADYGDKSGGFVSTQMHPLMDPNNLSVYANPSTGTFNIHVDLPDEGDTKIVITDINGKEVYAESLPNFSGVYDRTVTLQNAAKGTYFVKVSQSGYSSTKTVVIQ